MAANPVDLNLYQGDDFAAMVTVRTSDGSPADITGYTALAQMRREVADSDAVVAATFTSTVSSPYVILSLAHTVTEDLTGRYVWDLQVTSGTGAITTILAGRVSVTAEVSRAASA